MSQPLRRSGAAPAGLGDEVVLLGLVRDLVAERRTAECAASATLDSAFDRDLGLDSLALAELLTRVEDAFSVTLPPGLLATAAAPRDVLAEVRRAPVREVRRAPAARQDLPGPADRIPEETATVTEALAWHDRTHPDRVHLRVLGEDGTAQEATYGGLRQEAGRVAAGLLARGLRPGEAVAIMLPTGRDYFAVFTGIMLAGGVPVPIYPPGRPDRLAEHLGRQARILDNARACALITVAEAALPAQLLRGRVESVRHVLNPAELSGYGEIAGIPRDAADLALLQYTSGSTGDPKGVMLTHANLLADIRAMGEAIRVTTADVFVSWLPLYHDMGLVGTWLSSLYFGLPVAVMAPTSFLARPARWLWAVHEQRGTLTAGPNFAFELCLRKIDDAELDGLDLSCVRILFNGAEPVHAGTLEDFAARFARFGLRRNALTPVYGLAEACVGLTFPPPGRGPLVDRVARAEFTDRGRALPAAPDDPDELRFVACGRALPGHLVRVVDAAGAPLGDRREGRIEFRGPAATTGYFRNPDATDELIRNGWLDTGDLGYLDNGELFVTGRVKDLIIRAGHNLHPDELEHAVGEIAGIRKGCVAVFAARDPGGGTEHLVVLAETRCSDATALAALQGRVVAVTVDLLGTPPDEVVLAPPGTVPKTSSGKIRRATARASYERGDLHSARRPVWWQLTRFAARSAGPRLRRAARAGAAATFTAWCWACLAAVGLALLVAVALLPARAARAAARIAARTLLRCGGIGVVADGTGDGTDRVERLPACIVVANHASYLDSIALAAALPGRCTFVAGERFATTPVLGFLLRRIGTQFVERTDRAQGLADTQRLTEMARRGERLVMFPEGGLSPVPGLRPFHLGAFLIADNAERPIVPVAIAGTRAILPPGRARVVHRGVVHLAVGEPIVPAGTGWDAAITSERATRAAIAQSCGEPDLGR
jgi:1-acyl-sn-glycerol-3-phosphate acyltransferase